jgi:hypothetical protein
MKLILENWRQYISEDEVIDDNQDSVIFEISFKKAAERLGAKTLTKFVKRHLWDEKTGTIDYSPNEIAKIVWNLGQMLLSIVPIDLEDNQRGTVLEWLISKGLNDPNFSAGFVQANNIKQFVAAQRAEAEILGRYIPLWRRRFERFYHYQDFMKEKDLFALDTFDNLYEVIDEAEERIEAHQEKKSYLDAEKGTEIFRDDDEWRIYALHNKGAACHFGKGTEWCTAAPGLNYFENYYKPDDPLFYFEVDPMPRTVGPDRRWQFHYGSGQFMDEKDEQLEWEEALKFHKLLMQTDAPEKYPVVQEYFDLMMASEESTSTEELDKLADHKSEEVRWAVSVNLQTSQETLMKMIRKGLVLFSGIASREDLSHEVFIELAYKRRAEINARLVDNSATPPEAFDIIADWAFDAPQHHSVFSVLMSMAANRNTPPKILDKIAFHKYDKMGWDPDTLRIRVAANPNISPETLTELSKMENRNVRNTVASNRHTPFETLMDLADDPAHYVLLSLADTAYWKGRGLSPHRETPDWTNSLKLLDKILDKSKRFSVGWQKNIAKHVKSSKDKMGKWGSANPLPGKRDSVPMSGLMENWRKYQTLCEQESKLNAQIIQEASNIVDEGGTLNESILADLAKKYGTTPKEIKRLFMAAGLMIGGMGTYGASVLDTPEPPSIEQSATGGEQAKLPWQKKGRRGGYTGNVDVAGIIKGLAKNYNWKEAPTSMNAVYVPYDQIGDNDFLPKVNMKKAEYIETILKPRIEKELARGDVNAAKKNLKEFVYSDSWGYGKKISDPQFVTHPTHKARMLPLAWSVAYELYDSL